VFCHGLAKKFEENPSIMDVLIEHGLGDMDLV